ncbi:MAG: MucB/RseB C-terminal domain-containing protein [Chromatiaceae bacterium]|nr:MucB/RseB C-terminal domain-containing protein [Chromatiaceae bacterium]
MGAARAVDVSPHALLERMNDAVRQLDYEGRFVVQSGSQIDAMYIVHRFDGGAEKERVVSLTGSPREIIRSDEAVACVAPGKRLINVDRGAHARSFSPLRGVSAEQLEMSYHVELLAPGRVAGHDAYQILIQPRDDLRYGYRLFVDQDTALPLRSMMFDEAQQIVSQMMFVDLKTGSSVTPIEHDISAMQVARAGNPAPMPSERERLAPPAWTFADLPPGFQLNVHRRRPLAEANGDLEHFIFSDGLASVSVYIEPHAGDEALNGESSLGAAKAVGRILGDHDVVVVGEVPLKTLYWFAEHVRAASR